LCLDGCGEKRLNSRAAGLAGDNRAGLFILLYFISCYVVMVVFQLIAMGVSTDEKVI